ncbi:MAG: UbiD family decarboxylase [Deltaproteobacteria bacterium]|nr:UbiD family decarboxylase [Deltaproteobacteria bacterium]MBW2128488.1 UbiD family decarboxylase [Deltaproteobacteria bacterium]MBW2303653.1 UbiD family decarboxylase [Deltaproteobacteria bacterium]
MRAIRGLKEFALVLEDQGELQRVSLPLDPRYEIAALLSEMGKREAPALLFEKVKGCQTALIGNLLGTKKRLALALGIPERDLLRGHLPNLEKKIPPVPIQEEPPSRTLLTAEQGLDIGEVLPVLTHYVRDSGPYITAGITSARDPRDGTMGRGLHRMEIRGKEALGISLLNPPLADIYAYHRKHGTKMEVATAIGVDPVILFATVLKVPQGTDKLAVAGGLMGEAVCTERAKTVDLEVPAYSEIIIEGVIDPMSEERDGTLGEASGYYMSFSSSPTIRVTAISFREDPYFQAILPWSLEVDNLMSLIHGLHFIPKMMKEIPSLLDIHLVPGTFGSHVVMSIESENRAEIRRALTLALSFTSIKKAVIVNGDIDPRDSLEVEWALATRFQADRDLIVIPCVKGQPIDPSSGEGFGTAKLGMDATRPRKEGFEKVDFPQEIKGRLGSFIEAIRKE